MSEAYLLNTIFNDFLKFSWPVMLEVETLRLWYSLNSVLENFDVHPVAESECRRYASFKVTSILEDHVSVDVDVSEHLFVDYHTLQHLHSKLCDVMDKNLHATIDQFTTDHLPRFLVQHLSNLRLITIFDVSDFAETLHTLEMVHKYWLFRYKVVTMKKEEGKEESVEENSQNDNNNACNKINLIDSLRNNLELQFQQLHNYPEYARLRTLNSFVQLAMGTVGLLEHLLDWN